jgi:NADP-dependent 3-hydroxy acid dehydrogenase YdfG
MDDENLRFRQCWRIASVFRQIDVLINNAGLALGTEAHLASQKMNGKP